MRLVLDTRAKLQVASVFDFQNIERRFVVESFEFHGV